MYINVLGEKGAKVAKKKISTHPCNILQVTPHGGCPSSAVTATTVSTRSTVSFAATSSSCSVATPITSSFTDNTSTNDDTLSLDTLKVTSSAGLSSDQISTVPSDSSYMLSTPSTSIMHSTTLSPSNSSDSNMDISDLSTEESESGKSKHTMYINNHVKDM